MFSRLPPLLETRFVLSPTCRNHEDANIGLRGAWEVSRADRLSSGTNTNLQSLTGRNSCARERQELNTVFSQSRSVSSGKSTRAKSLKDESNLEKSTPNFYRLSLGALLFCKIESP